MKNLVVSLVLLSSAQAFAAVTNVQATNDASNSYYQYNYSGTPSFLQVYLDTDRSASTGYRVGGIGASFLIENNGLFRYTGSGTNWSWAFVQNITMSKTTTSVRFTVSRASLGSPSSLNLVAQTQPPVSTSGIVSQTFVSPAAIGTPQATSDATNAFYSFTYSGATALYKQIFLDVDSNASTGYSVGGIGAEYLLENGALFRFSGSGATAWGWNLLKAVSFTGTSTSAKWTVARADLGSPASLKLVGRVDSPSMTSSIVSQTLSTSTPLPQPQPLPQPEPTPLPQPNPSPVGQVTYSPSSTIMANPERGFYWFIRCESQMWNASDLQRYRSEGISVVGCMFYLNNFKNSAISQSALDFFQKNMDVLRANGMKAFVRFAYTENTAGDDAAPSRVLSHLDQLAPFFTKNSDVIFVVQAGFIGAWGEWAYSQNFGNSGNLSAQNWADRKAFTDKLLQVVPADRMVQLRTPAFKTKMYGATALSSTEAFNKSARARLGHHNDCFLASSSDWGTYENVSVEYPYLQEETKYTGMGGETCNVSAPRSDCTTAMKEMGMFHWSYLNQGYHQDVIQNWKNQGCFDTIRTKLGYRFVMQNGSFSTSAKVGSSIQVTLNLVNQGYAAPFNPRPLELILRNNSTGAVHKVALNSDPRKWLPGQTITVNQTVALPSSLGPGNYSLLLNLPDAAPTLSGNPAYSIQLANTNVWEASTGFNKLNHTLTVLQ